MKSDTIIALSSGRLPAGVGVVRCSGPMAKTLAENFLGVLPAPRSAHYSELRDSQGSLIDRGIALFFPAPSSFTGEDVLELHVHGGRAVVDAVLRTACRREGVRLADAGEFTQRAFINGKLGLLEAEAMADLIGSETEAQRCFAANIGSGGHREFYAGWRKTLIHARAMLEAEIDFVDEGDVAEDVSGGVWSTLRHLEVEMRKHVAGFAKAEILRDGLDVVILGEPNSGKSTLLNALINREAAIVSDIPGTTRDLIEVALDIDGYKVRLTDTAGIRHSADTIERIGIERALARSAKADLVLNLVPLDMPAAEAIPSENSKILVVGTRADLAGPTIGRAVDVSISAVTGDGLGELTALLRDAASRAVPRTGEIVPWRRRHLSLIEKAIASLSDAQAGTQEPIEIRIEHLRSASDSIGKIAGEVDVEDLLDVIFSQFCIGK